MGVERDYTLRFKTVYDGSGAERAKQGVEATTAAVRKLTDETKKSAVESAQFFADRQHSTEQAATKARVLANLQESARARQSSNIDDNSGAAAARIQRRLEAQRAEAAAVQAAVPIMDDASAATNRLTNQKKLLEGSLKRLSGQFPILHTAVHALKDPIFGAAAAFAALSAASSNYASQAEARLQSLIDRLSGGVNAVDAFATSVKTRLEESKIAQENFNKELQKTVDDLNTIDEITSRRASATDRAEREQQAQLGLEKAEALVGVTDPVKRATIEAQFAGRSRRVSEEAARAKAAQLAGAQRMARQAATEAKQEMPFALGDQKNVNTFLDSEETKRQKLEEYQKFLEEEVRTSDQFTRNPNEVRLHAATWGQFGKPWKDGLSKEQAQKELERVKGLTAGFGADRQRDAATRKEWSGYVADVDRVAKGGERFTPRFNEASAEATTQRRIGGITDQTDAVRLAEDAAKAGQETVSATDKANRHVAQNFRALTKEADRLSAEMKQVQQQIQNIAGNRQ